MSDFIGWFTGGNITRLAATLLAGLVVGGFCAVKVEEWRWTSKVASEKLAESEAKRNDEKARNVANQKVDYDYQQTKARNAADLRTANDRLHELQAAIDRTNTNTATQCGADADPRDCIIAQCAGVAVDLDAAVKKFSGQAIGLQSYAREVCVTTPK